MNDDYEGPVADPVSEEINEGLEAAGLEPVEPAPTEPTAAEDVVEVAAEADPEPPAPFDDEPPNFKDILATHATAAADPDEHASPAADDAPARKGRGELELAVKDVTDAFNTGELVLEDGQYLTPHRIAKEVEKSGYKPSTGAVAAALKRWYEIGYIVVNEKPFAFLGYTSEAMTQGLAELKNVAAKRRRATPEAAPAAPPETTEA